MRQKSIQVSCFAILLIGLTACSQSKPGTYEELFQDKAIKVEKSRAPDPVPMSPINAPQESAADASAGQNNNQTETQQNLIAAPLLAYEYEMSVRLPIDKVGLQMRSDLERCVKAGPSNCQLITSRANEGDGNASAYLAFKAQAKWLESFRASIDKSAKENGGRIFSSSVSSEDLTMHITDTQARIRALTSLRERLEKIIAERPGKLADLLEAEKELSRVQGDLDSLVSQLNVAKTRVQMSVMKIEYNSSSVSVTSSVFDPISQALSDFFYSMMQVFAFMINALAVLIPAAIVIVPIAFFVRKYVKMREAKKTELMKEGD